MDTFTLQQVAEHNTPQNAWIAIHGNGLPLYPEKGLFESN